MKKITMNQEELLQAMKLRPDILVAIRFLKEAAERLELVVQVHENERIPRAIHEFFREAEKDLKQIREAGVALDKFTKNYLLK